MGQYDRQIATVLRLVSKYGQSVTWVTVEDGTPSNSDQPWKPSQAVEVSFPVSIAFFTIDKEMQRTLMFLSNSVLPIGLTIGLMGKQDFQPKLKDYFLRDNKRKTLKNVETLRPNDQVIMHTIEFLE